MSNQVTYHIHQFEDKTGDRKTMSSRTLDEKTIQRLKDAAEIHGYPIYNGVIRTEVRTFKSLAEFVAGK